MSQSGKTLNACRYVSGTTNSNPAWRLSLTLLFAIPTTSTCYCWGSCHLVLKLVITKGCHYYSDHRLPIANILPRQPTQKVLYISLSDYRRYCSKHLITVHQIVLCYGMNLSLPFTCHWFRDSWDRAQSNNTWGELRIYSSPKTAYCYANVPCVVLSSSSHQGHCHHLLMRAP